LYIKAYALDLEAAFNGLVTLISGNILGESNILHINKTNGVITLISGNSGGGNNDGAGNPAPSIYYYYSDSSNNWYSVYNWWTNSNHTTQATTLPPASADVVVIEGTVSPVVNLDSPSWIQPDSINAGTTGITFTSQNFGNVTCSISGNATFEGNATYNV
jgi:hypothetical protein